MANYPDWVLKYKKPGHYLNKYKDHYRLYKGHCEYRNGKYVRIVDEYLGTITEKDGLIPSKGLINSDVLVYEYGFYLFLFNLLKNIYNGQIRTHKKYADTIMVLAISRTFNISNSLIYYTALKLLYPNYDDKLANYKLTLSETDRVCKMIEIEYSKCSNINNIEKILSTLKLVYINKRYYLSQCDKDVYQIFNTFGFEVKCYGQN